MIFFRLVTVKSSEISVRGGSSVEDPDYDNLHPHDSSSDNEGSSNESEDEEELNGIVLRKWFE